MPPRDEAPVRPDQTGTPPQNEFARLGVRDFVERFRNEMIPLNNRFSYFPAVPLNEDELKEYLEEPIAALPSGIQAQVSQALIFLVPYLEKAGPKAAEAVTFAKPEPKNEAASAQFSSGDASFVVLAVRDREVADYHYAFYRATATIVVDRTLETGAERFFRLIRDEVRGNVHGEVDEEAWKLKMQLVRKQSDMRRDSKLFRAYARQSMIDTLTLYLHGICCDIDVDTGPRQLPSRFLRKRLELLREMYPPPSGYVVFPEELSE